MTTVFFKVLEFFTGASSEAGVATTIESQIDRYAEQKLEELVEKVVIPRAEKVFEKMVKDHIDQVLKPAVEDQVEKVVNAKLSQPCTPVSITREIPQNIFNTSGSLCIPDIVHDTQ